MDKKIWFAHTILFTTTLVIGCMFYFFLDMRADQQLASAFVIALSLFGIDQSLWFAEFPPLKEWLEPPGISYTIYERTHGYDRDNPRSMPLWQATLLAYRDALQGWLAACYCHLQGHKIISDGGWAGPDSGGDDFYCERCGFSQHIVYY